MRPILVHRHTRRWGKRGLPRGLAFTPALASAFWLQGCSAFSRGFLAPAGPIAAAERHELFVVSAIMLLVIGPVLLLTPLIAWHYRRSNTKSVYQPQWGFSWSLEALIWIPPTMIVVVLSVLLWENTERLDPYRPLSSALPPLQIQAVSLDWKWLFIYPDQHIASVNQLIVPVGRPVHFSLTSGTVMQSFLLPRLAGQIFTMAGMMTQLNIAVSAPGIYWGENGQFNGTGFQQQKFQVIGVSAADFNQWVANLQKMPSRLDDKAYQNLSRQSILPHPISFGNVEPGIFVKIVNQAITPGYVGQHEEAKSHE
jgi:cytochrome o ubiquinol oxidase subunit 2